MIGETAVPEDSKGLRLSRTNLIPDLLKESSSDATLQAPEVYFEKENNVGNSIDIWNIGATLLKLAVNFDPTEINEKTLKQFLRGRTDFERELLKEMPIMEKKLLWGTQNPWIKELILRCLAVKPSERATSAQLANWSTFRAIRELLPHLSSSESRMGCGDETQQPAEIGQNVSSDDEDEFNIWRDFGDSSNFDQNNAAIADDSVQKKPSRRALAGLEAFLEEYGDTIVTEKIATVSSDAPQQQEEETEEKVIQTSDAMEVDDAELTTKKRSDLASPDYFDKELAKAEEMKRNKTPRSILKSNTNPNKEKELENLRVNSTDTTESVRRKRAREPIDDRGIHVMVKNDIRELQKLLDRGKLPTDFEGFWKALKHVNNNWRRFPLQFNDIDADFVYTNVMGLKEENLPSHIENIEYFLGSKQFLNFLEEQCRLIGGEQILIDNLEALRTTIPNPNEDDNGEENVEESTKRLRSM